MSDISEDVKEKFNDTKDSFSKNSKDSKDDSNENVYQYTVKFEDRKRRRKRRKIIILFLNFIF